MAKILSLLHPSTAGIATEGSKSQSESGHEPYQTTAMSLQGWLCGARSNACIGEAGSAASLDRRPL